MPTADATLLPPPPPFANSSSAEERSSARRLDEVGVETVLGAMIEQKRRASQPSYPSFTPAEAEAEDGEAPAERRTPTKSEVFLKAR